MRWRTYDHRENDSGHGRRSRLDVGFWLYDVPRVTLLCRLLGHRPVIAGTETFREGSAGHRWVCCDRCGTRPDPQGDLDPAAHPIGSPYSGTFDAQANRTANARRTVVGLRTADRLPGSWPDKPTGHLGGQLILGRGALPGFSVEVKVGNPGSEHVLAAHARLSPLGALYLHSERHGTFLQRRLNPDAPHSREIGVTVERGRLWWKLWAPRDNGCGGEPVPRWQAGQVSVDPRDLLLGRRQHRCVEVGDPVVATVRLPHGDDHEVTLRLREVHTGRPRGRVTRRWAVEWVSRDGIPCRKSRSRIGGRAQDGTVDVDERAVRRGTWPAEAAAAVAVRITAWRAANDYTPPRRAQAVAT